MRKTYLSDIDRLLGIRSPWRVLKITRDDKSRTADIHVTYEEDSKLQCPECDRICTGYDYRPRRWPYKDICDYRTMLVADVPRVECSEHGVKTISVPWRE